MWPGACPIGRIAQGLAAVFTTVDVGQGQLGNAGAQSQRGPLTVGQMPIHGCLNLCRGHFLDFIGFMGEVQCLIEAVDDLQLIQQIFVGRQQLRQRMTQVFFEGVQLFFTGARLEKISKQRLGMAHSLLAVLGGVLSWMTQVAVP